MSEIMHTLGIDPRVMAAQFTAFVLLWIVLAKYLFRPVLSLLDAREQEVRQIFETAEKERSEAEKLRADYESRIAEIEAEARAKIQSAIREGQIAKDEIIGEARARAEVILRQAQQDLAREREKVLMEIRQQAVDISLTAAARVIGEALDENRHRKLIAEFIEKLGASR